MDVTYYVTFYETARVRVMAAKTAPVERWRTQ